MRVRLENWCGRLVITVPQAIVRGAGLREGDTVDLEIRDETILAKLVGKITPENRHPEIPVRALIGTGQPHW